MQEQKTDLREDTLVSVVIPTLQRPEAVMRAVRSVLRQTYTKLEIHVIVDGPDRETRAALASIEDERLHIHELPERVGVAQARNTGIAQSRGRWIAFLDDDDQWMEQKLAIQVRAAQDMHCDRVLLTSYYIDRGADYERVLPHRSPSPGEPISELLFCKRGWLSRSSMLQTSTFFVTRTVAASVPFRKIRPQEDLDWLMRASQQVDTPMRLLPDVLSIYHNEKTIGREGAIGAFEVFWDYAHRNRDLFTPLSFTSYLATFCAPEIRRAENPWRCCMQVYRGMKSGKLTPRSLLIACFFALFPFQTRRRLRLLVGSLLRMGRSEGVNTQALAISEQ